MPHRICSVSLPLSGESTFLCLCMSQWLSWQTGIWRFYLLLSDAKMAKGLGVMCTSPSAAPTLPSLLCHWRLGLKGLVPLLYPTAGTWGRSTPRREACPGPSIAWLSAGTGDAGPPPPSALAPCTPQGAVLTGVGVSQVDKPTCPTNVHHKFGTHSRVHSHVHSYSCMHQARVCSHLSRHVHPLPFLCQGRREQAAGGSACPAPWCGPGTGRGDRKGREGKVFFLVPIELYLGCFPTCIGRQNHTGTAEEIPPRAEDFP